MYRTAAGHIQPEASPLHSWFNQDRKTLSSAILEAAGSLHESHKLPLFDELVAIDKLSVRSSVLNPHDIYNLHHELERVRETFQKEILIKSIDFSVYIAADIPIIYSDTNSLRIQSLRENILNPVFSNAIRHTPSGSRIAIRVDKFGSNAITINISDSGPFHQLVTQGPITSQHADQPSNSSPIRNTQDLHKARLCAQAHNGTLSVVQESGFPEAIIKIGFPLYGACAQ